MTLTIPANSSVAIPVGYQYHFVEIGTERTTFAPAAGVTIGSKNSQLFLDGRYSKGSLVKVSTNEWVLFGDIYEGVSTPTPTPTPTPPSPTPTPTPPSPTPAPPSPTPTPTPTIYYVSGCCSTSGLVIGDSTISFADAQNDFVCTDGTITSILTSNTEYPVQNCNNPPTPSPAGGPTIYDIYTYCDSLFPAMRGGAYGAQPASGYVNVGTTTNPSLTSEQIVALLGYGSSCPPVPNPGTIYLSYCSDGAPVTSGPVTIDGNNFISSNINTACADYTSFLTNSGATNISCSTVSQPAAPTNCSTTPTPAPPSPTPTPITPTAPTPTPAPPDCQSCTSYQPNADGSYGTRNNSSCASGSEYYRVCITPYGCENIITSGGCVPVTPSPVAPPPAPPAPVAPTPTPGPPAPTPASPGGCVPGELCQAIESGGCYYIYSYNSSCGCVLTNTVC